MSDIREHIMRYLKIKKKIDIKAGRLIMERDKLFISSMQYEFPREIKQKFDIVLRLNRYYKKSVSYNIVIPLVLRKIKTVDQAAAISTLWYLTPETIQRKVDRYRDLIKKGKAKEPYKYDKPLFPWSVFTFNEELALITDLHQWKLEAQSSCICLICALVYLASLAYQSAREKGKKYPPEWDEHQQADHEWLISFEMTHSYKLEQLYKYNTVQEIYETCKNKQLYTLKKETLASLLSEEKNTFKRPTFPLSCEMTPPLDKRRRSSSKKSSEFDHDEETVQTSETATATFSQDNQDTCALTDHGKIASNDICQEENFDLRQAYNQNTNELRNINDLMNDNLEGMSEADLCSKAIDFITDQFQNISLSNESQLLDDTNKDEETNDNSKEKM